MAHMCGQVKEGSYVYLSHLLALDACQPTPMEQGIRGWIQTPLKLDVWKQELASHPDPGFVKYIISGIESGFRIGFDRAMSLRSASSNPLVEPGSHNRVSG